MAETQVTSESKIKLNVGLHERRVGDKVFVLDRSSVMHAFDNDVAVTIWDLLSAASPQAISLNTITKEIVAAFEVSQEVAVGDALSFAQLLLARGIVSRAD